MRGDGAAFAIRPNQGSEATATGTAPLQGAKQTDVLRPGLWASGRPAMSDARVPAGQNKGAALWSAFMRPVCDDKIPAHFSYRGAAGCPRGGG